MRTWIKNVKTRRAEIAMLHIGLNSGFWHPMDVIFVLTGWVIG
jgi:D-alanyl-lipoteichoic acid acyltransferase DltB (MBOAT superfamily)